MNSAETSKTTKESNMKRKLFSYLLSIQSILNWEGKVIAPALDEFLNKHSGQGTNERVTSRRGQWRIRKSKC